MMAPATAYVIGVDGGQTSTKAAIAGLDGRVLALAEGGPWDLLVTDEVRARCRATLAGLFVALRGAVPPGEAVVRQVALGLTGGFVGSDLVRAWVAELLPGAGVTVVEDQVSNYRGGNPLGGPGAVVIAGGGSIAWGIDADGRSAFAGGVGHGLDDEGSGYEIGRQAIIAALKAYQGRIPATVLTERLVARMGASDPWDLRIAFYDGRLDRPAVAALTPLVAQAAAEGDEAALTILIRAGRDLADMAAAVIRRLALERARVYPTGGVFNAGIVRRSFETVLAELAPDATAVDPLLPPLGGALALALEGVGALDQAAVDALTATIG